MLTSFQEVMQKIILIFKISENLLNIIKFILICIKFISFINLMKISKIFIKTFLIKGFKKLQFIFFI